MVAGLECPRPRYRGYMALPAREELSDVLSGIPGFTRLLEAVGSQPGVYLVGGAPRDLLLGRQPCDFDLVVEHDGLKVAQVIAERLGATIVIHDRFQTASIAADGFGLDVACSRAERYPHPGDLPQVRPASLAEDLLRRDFSVHAIAVGVSADEVGQIIAAPGSLEDLEARQLRVIHRGSFRDDPTRLLRLVRYAARLEFVIEPETKGLAKEAAADGALATVSVSRIGSEMRLILAEASAISAREIAGSCGICEALSPGFAIDRGLCDRGIDLLPDDGRRDLMILASASLALAPKDLVAWLDGMEFCRSDRDAVVEAVSVAQEMATRLRETERPSQLAAVVGAHTPLTVALAGAVGAQSQARAWLEDLRHITTSICGEDLLAVGVREGPDIGVALAAALSAKLDGEAQDYESEIKVALAAVVRS